ncbi:MAG: hypothetical protein HKN14_08345 [Marinicaulis sp.]|nr:hypothetical protein [Marinicaulis sp.]
MRVNQFTKFLGWILGVTMLSGCALFQSGDKYAGHNSYAIKKQNVSELTSVRQAVRSEATQRYSDDAPYREAAVGAGEPEILCDENGARVVYRSEAEHRAEHADEFGFLSDARSFRGDRARAVDGGALKMAYDD